MSTPLASIRNVPFYPALMFVGWVLTVLADSAASVQAVGRPILVGLAIVIAVLAIATLLLRDAGFAGIVTSLIGLIVIGLAPLALALAVVVLLYLVRSSRKDPAGSARGWGQVTRWLNVVSLITLGLVVASAATGGALAMPSAPSTIRPTPATIAPDIYVVLLDGYARTDTLADRFGFDNRAFLESMEALGFEVAARSHSTSNVTHLTLASIFDMTGVAELRDRVDKAASPQVQYRALTRAINEGAGLDALHAHGYEIVAIPSPITSASLFAADRVIDGGQMTEFEYDLLQQGVIPRILPEVQRTWLLDQHRDRIASTFDVLGDLAAEPTDHPRFIFAHLMTPHAPYVFGPSGEVREDLPCFPQQCPIFFAGQGLGIDLGAPIRDQTAYVNRLVARTAERIQSASPRPAVIVFFSDHGSRADFDDRDEMLRSFFIAATPGQPGLFPDDTSPGNLIPRLLNAYTGAGLPFASEDSYVVDMRRVETTGPLDLQRVDAR